MDPFIGVGFYGWNPQLELIKEENYETRSLLHRWDGLVFLIRQGNLC